MESFHDFLKRVIVFKDFNEEDKNELLRITNRVRVKPEQVICREGEPGLSMYIVREGVIQVRRQSSDGRSLTLARLSEGEVVGEMALVDGAPRSASLVAETEGVLYEIRRNALDGMKQDMNPAAFKLLRAIANLACERLRQANLQIQHYLEHPAALFMPEIKLGTDAPVESGLKERVAGLLKRFGSPG